MPKHARSSRLPARLAVTTALGGLLVPLATAGPASAAERSSSTTRVSAPAGTVSPGAKAPVSVRLLEGRSYVPGAVVDVQVPEGSGWRTVARATTDRRGIARTAVRVTHDTEVRAHYRGSSSLAPDTSGSDRIEVAGRPSRLKSSSAASSRTAGSTRGVLAEAARHRGAPYRYGATGPSAFDCSGFTRYVYAKATGKTLPHSSRGQEQVSHAVSKSEARPGDLVFIQDVSGHVGIYAGDGKMWDAPRSGKTVTLRRIWTSNYTVGRV